MSSYPNNFEEGLHSNHRGGRLGRAQDRGGRGNTIPASFEAHSIFPNSGRGNSFMPQSASGPNYHSTNPGHMRVPTAHFRDYNNSFSPSSQNSPTGQYFPNSARVDPFVNNNIASQQQHQQSFQPLGPSTYHNPLFHGSYPPGAQQARNGSSDSNWSNNRRKHELHAFRDVFSDQRRARGQYDAPLRAGHARRALPSAARTDDGTFQQRVTPPLVNYQWHLSQGLGRRPHLTQRAIASRGQLPPGGARTTSLPSTANYGSAPTTTPSSFDFNSPSFPTAPTLGYNAGPISSTYFGPHGSPHTSRSLPDHPPAISKKLALPPAFNANAAAFIPAPPSKKPKKKSDRYFRLRGQRSPLDHLPKSMTPAGKQGNLHDLLHGTDSAPVPLLHYSASSPDIPSVLQASSGLGSTGGDPFVDEPVEETMERLEISDGGQVAGSHTGIQGGTGQTSDLRGLDSGLVGGGEHVGSENGQNQAGSVHSRVDEHVPHSHAGSPGKPVSKYYDYWTGEAVGDADLGASGKNIK